LWRRSNPPEKTIVIGKKRGFAANDGTCNELSRVLPGQARGNLGDAGTDCLRHFYGRPRAAAHSYLFRRADRLIAASPVLQPPGQAGRRSSFSSFCQVRCRWPLSGPPQFSVHYRTCDPPSDTAPPIFATI